MDGGGGGGEKHSKAKKQKNNKKKNNNKKIKKATTTFGLSKTAKTEVRHQGLDCGSLCGQAALEDDSDCVGEDKNER